MTTILSRMDSGTWLAEWRERVGAAEADAICEQARVRGSDVHSIAEAYLLGQDYTTGRMPANLKLFRQIKPAVDASLGTIYGIEIPLISATLKCGGRADLVAEWDGVPAIIDFKTSKKVKGEDDILSYFVQTTAYSLMVEEMYGIRPRKLVILMMVDHAREPLIFVRDRKAYFEKVAALFVENRK